MADEIEDVVGDTDEVTVQEQEKTFTQSQVNQIIARRLKKEAKNYEDEAGILGNRVASLESHLQKLISTQISALPDAVKTLLSKLPVEDQIAWLNETGGVGNSPNIPETPKAVEHKQKFVPTERKKF